MHKDLQPSAMAKFAAGVASLVAAGKLQPRGARPAPNWRAPSSYGHGPVWRGPEPIGCSRRRQICGAGGVVVRGGTRPTLGSVKVRNRARNRVARCSRAANRE